MPDAVDEGHADKAHTDDNPPIKKTGSLNHLKPFNDSVAILREAKALFSQPFRSYL